MTDLPGENLRHAMKTSPGRSGQTMDRTKARLPMRWSGKEIRKTALFLMPPCLIDTPPVRFWRYNDLKAFWLQGYAHLR
jgi:hypothetical protein